MPESEGFEKYTPQNLKFSIKDIFIILVSLFLFRCILRPFPFPHQIIIWKYHKNEHPLFLRSHVIAKRPCSPFTKLFDVFYFQRLQGWFKQINQLFSPDAEKYGPEKLRIRTLITQWEVD